MKKKWDYNYKKGLKAAMVSEELVKKDHYYYFVFKYGISDWKSEFIKFDADTLQARTIFEEDHIIRSTGLFEEDKFYFTSFKGLAYCMDIDGNLLWTTNISRNNADINVASDEDRIYVSNYSLYCLDKNTGNIIWKNEDSKEKTGCNYAINSKYIYHSDLGGSINCYDKYTGESIWKYGKDLYVRSCALLDEKCLLAFNEHGKFMFINADTGELIRETKADGYLNSTPVFYNGNMYVGDANNVINSDSGHMNCYKINENYELKKIFSFKTGGDISAKAKINGTNLYFASEDGYLYCLDYMTGEEVQKKRKTKGECRDIYIEGGELVLLSDRGQLECFTL